MKTKADLEQYEKIFGHTMTIINNSQAILFGGMVKKKNLEVSNLSYLYNILTKEWSNVKSTGMIPTKRAGHSSILIKRNKMLIFGGIDINGKLSDHNLYKMNYINEEKNCVWVQIDMKGKKPEERYGHVMKFYKPYIILFGGQSVQYVLNDCWIIKLQKNVSLFWEKLNFDNEIPKPRVYSAGDFFLNEDQEFSLIIFGGRDSYNKPLNDIWMLEKIGNSLKWNWIKITYSLSKNQIFDNCDKNKTQKQSDLSESSIIPYMQEKEDYNEKIVYRSNKKDSKKIDFDCFVKDKNINKPGELISRFQHTVHIYKNMIIIIGGKMNNDNRFKEFPPIQIFDIYKKKIIYSDSEIFFQFRHCSFLTNKKIYIYGGFLSYKKNEIFCLDLNFFGKIDVTKDNSYKINEVVVLNKNDAEFLKLDQLKREHKKIKKKNSINVRLLNPKQNVNNINKLCDYIINCLLKPEIENNKKINFFIDKNDVFYLCEELIEILKNEPVLINLNFGLKIFGSLFGDYFSLMKIFKNYGIPEKIGFGNKCDLESVNYLFLGNYVGFGKFSVEILCLIFALKIKYPKSIFLLKGFYDELNLNQFNGFGKECEKKFKEDIFQKHSVFQTFNKVFQFLSLAALIENNIFCLNSNFQTIIQNYNNLSSIKKPYLFLKNIEFKFMQKNLFEDLKNYFANNRNLIKKFMDSNKFEIFITSYFYDCEGVFVDEEIGLYNIFSCVSFFGVNQNKAVIFFLHQRTRIIKTYFLESNDNNKENWYNLESLEKFVQKNKENFPINY